MSAKISGVFPVLPCPFDAEGRPDEAGLRRVIDFVVASGADGVVFPGLASEYDHLSLDERLALIDVVGRHVGQRAAFIVGGSSGKTEDTIALMRAGKAAGAVGAMIMTPPQFAEDRQGLIDFYRTVGREGGLPVMLQNAPRPMGVGLSAEEVAAVVAAAPEIAWVKEENMPCGQRISVILANRPAHLQGVFGGAGGRYIVDELSRGAIGTMPAAELPEAHVALMAAHAKGDEDGVRTMYETMLPLLMMQAVFRWDLTKEVLRRRGLIDSAFVRASGPRFDAGDHQELTALLARVQSLTGPLPVGV